MLLAGKPLLLLPLMLEQRLTADAVVRLGAGERAAPNDVASVREKLDALLGSDGHAAAARRFAENHADFDPAAQVEKIVRRVEELLGRNRAGRAEGAAPRAEAAWARPAKTRRPESVFRA